MEPLETQMTFQSRSQAGQDLFTWHVLRYLEYGRFLDVGSNHPVEKNNTYEFQRRGWDGGLVEVDEYCYEITPAARDGLAGGYFYVKDDATTFDWTKIAPEFKEVHYLSLDVDAATPAALRRMLDGGIHFRVGTIEHDRWRFGNGPAEEIANLLTLHGYEILCDDVSDQGMPFEFWVVDPKAVDMEIANRFRATGPTDWREILRRGGIEI